MRWWQARIKCKYLCLSARRRQCCRQRVGQFSALVGFAQHLDHAGLLGANGQPTDANNLLVNIHHNEILKNGNTAGDESGGGDK